MRTLLVGLIAGSALLMAAPPGGAATPPTTVTLGFDDGFTSAYTLVAPMLASHGMHGTFSIISELVGSGGYMSWSQISSLAAAGNEIAGHTVSHPDLASLSTTQVRHEVCGNRADLLARGLLVTDFTYPFGTIGTINSQIEQIVAECGYNSARTSLWYGDGCPYPCTQSLPPSDPFWTTVIGWGEQGLASLEAEVTSAETFGGWAQLVFHDVCDSATDASCASSGVTTSATLRAFLDWLSGQVAQGRVNVATVHDVIGGPLRPLVAAPVLSGVPPATTSSTSASIGFSGESGATFACSLDNAAFARCTSPAVLANLSAGAHTFAVTQTDTNGDVSSPATASWTIQGAPPPPPPPPALAPPTLWGVPPAQTTSRYAVLRFSGVSRARFTCSLDGRAYYRCTSPQTLTNLSYSTHTFAVRQTDTTGRTSAAATGTWTVVRTQHHHR